MSEECGGVVEVLEGWVAVEDVYQWETNVMRCEILEGNLKTEKG